MKYKVGDKVRVRKDLIANDFYGKYNYTCGYSMTLLLGEELIISEVCDEYYIAEGVSMSRWTDEMLEDVDEEFKLPEKWCIKSTKENIESLGKYWDDGCRVGKLYSRKEMFPYWIGQYWCSYNLASGNLLFSEEPGSNHIIYSKPEGLLEITTYQFKKYVLKSEATPVKEEVKFEKGKWYKGEPSDYYFKAAGGVEQSESWYNLVPVTEEIISGIHEVVSRYWSNDKYEKFALENPVDLSEIQQYLPEGHPDKINTLEQSRESLLEEAKRRYPVGTKFKSVSDGNIYVVHKSHNVSLNKSSFWGYWILVVIDDIGHKEHLYYDGKWAEIVESPTVKQKITPDLLVKVIPPVQSLLLRDGMYVVGVDPIADSSIKNKGESKSNNNESDFRLYQPSELLIFHN